MPAQGGILVMGEVADGALSLPTTEVLGAARRLAEASGASVAIALLGSGLDGVSREAIAYGADHVYAVDDPAVAEFSSDAYVAVLERLVKEIAPDIVLIPHTPSGREVGPRLAFRLGTGLASDCESLRIDSSTGRLVATHPCYGGAVRMELTWPEGVKPQIATVRPKTQEPLPRDESRQGEVLTVGAGIAPDQVRIKFLEAQKIQAEGVRLEDAAIVVAGGRGLGSAENFRYVEELAKVLGAAVGASRAIVDDGWVPYAYQVGLTGKTIAPDLYIAIGISGASQHMAGLANARTIVGINRDPSADIWKYARFGVVGDFQKVVPAFKAKLEELLRS